MIRLPKESLALVVLVVSLSAFACLQNREVVGPGACVKELELCRVDKAVLLVELEGCSTNAGGGDLTGVSKNAR